MKFIGLLDHSLLNVEAIIRFVPTQDTEGYSNGWMAEALNTTGEMYCIGHYGEDAAVSVVSSAHARILIEDFLANKDSDDVLHIENSDNVKWLWEHREPKD